MPEARPVPRLRALEGLQSRPNRIAALVQAPRDRIRLRQEEVPARPAVMAAVMAAAVMVAAVTEAAMAADPAGEDVMSAVAVGEESCRRLRQVKSHVGGCGR